MFVDLFMNHNLFLIVDNLKLHISYYFVYIIQITTTIEFNLSKELY